MREIVIKHKTKGTHVLLLDDEDYQKYSHLKWSIKVGGSGIVYARAWTYDTTPRKQYFAHRLVMNESDSSVCIDHKDRNGLNNQKSNLRRASKKENRHNSIYTKNNLFGLKGVSLSPSKKSYRVYISTPGLYKYGGSFRTPIEAAKRYNELARQYYGEFAYQNPV